MARSPVPTRIALPADVPVLVELWGELRQVGGRAERAVNPMAVSDIAERFLDAVTGRRVAGGARLRRRSSRPAWRCSAPSGPIRSPTPGWCRSHTWSSTARSGGAASGTR